MIKITEILLNYVATHYRSPPQKSDRPRGSGHGVFQLTDTIHAVHQLGTRNHTHSRALPLSQKAQRTRYQRLHYVQSRD